ncbi:hypothetical protein vBKpnPMUC100_047 [Klebsiella phage vB_KpnP_MUC100]|uniref:Uncharacterized protein n=1 Tax=Klebsiella phage vB_KpnP_MUC100 TaxID=3065244 RepID=A0AAX4G486_9CAUD|nr:hypothetical protein vBKpnPMUC100_047 [Klebsiella phage vB_KpnP_MUC100]
MLMSMCPYLLVLIKSHLESHLRLDLRPYYLRFTV